MADIIRLLTRCWWHTRESWDLCIATQLNRRAKRAPSHDLTLIARFMGPTWGPSGADRTQVGPMLDPWTLLSGEPMLNRLPDAYVCKYFYGLFNLKYMFPLKSLNSYWSTIIGMWIFHVNVWYSKVQMKSLRMLKTINYARKLVISVAYAIGTSAGLACAACFHQVLLRDLYTQLCSVSNIFSYDFWKAF